MERVTPTIEDMNSCTKSPSSIHECKTTNLKGYSMSGVQHLVLLTI